MHNKRDGYEIDQNEKYLLTKKSKHEGIFFFEISQIIPKYV